MRLLLPVIWIPSLRNYDNLSSILKNFEEERAAFSGIVTADDKSWFTPVNWLAFVQLFNESFFQIGDGFFEVVGIAESINIFLETGIHHKTVGTNKLNTIILKRIV